MANAKTDEPTRQKPLRLWPGVVIVVLQWLARFGVPIVVPEATAFGVIGGLFGGLAVVVWWAFFSRAPRSERWGGVGLMIVALVATSRFIHESIATSMMGMMFAVYATPVLSLAFVVWAVASRRLSDGPRRATMFATILLACGVWTLVRTGGFTGDLDHDFAWRWAETPEERLLAQAGDEPTALPSAPAAMETGADWPGFRGPDRDGIIPGVRIVTDWSRSPPVELWRRPIGPGWSSFAVRGDLLYTQEQRGDDEVVACYKVTTGEPRWFGPAGGDGYSSPHLVTIDGVAQILLLSGAGATSVAPADGTLLWEHPWPGDRIVQPALTADGDILIGTGFGIGTRRIAVAHGPGGWTIEERWTSVRLKPYFNDFVVHDDHAFGFDGSILACIDVEDGKRKWKGGRYGHGQLVLLPDQDLLLVLSEQGELALVAAAPDQFTELARFPAIEGKTWNHPVLVGDVLLVRNAQEMAAFRLSLAGG